MHKIVLFWFRRDLRLEDNAGLYHALKGPHPVLPLFIFDKVILDKLDEPHDSRVDFIYQQIKQLDKKLSSYKSNLLVYYDTPLEAWRHILGQYDVQAVYSNHDYEPYARERDKGIAALLKEKGIQFHTFKDQVIFEKSEVVKDNAEPYTVFTPFSKKWKAKLNDFYLSSYPTLRYKSNFYKWEGKQIPSLTSMGFEETGTHFPSDEINEEVLRKYGERRDFPAIKGTSRLGIHLRFGTISIRELAREAKEANDTFLGELIWRDFYQMILWHFPHVQDYSFKPAYDKIRWRNDEKEFTAWCEGKTGYPLVDAGMRELNESGFMHNRVRMVTASFLAKHLLIDWRWGEAYFGKKLLDYDLAPNNGGWQWAAGCGTDAAPYFRVFNPELQAKKFDAKREYIKNWVPEWGTDAYPAPIVNHEWARERCLKEYKRALNS